jgi:nucleoside-diphosphate-sugar epimerase
VYGSGENANLQTMYGFRRHPNWRWTHGYVENVGAAIVIATLRSEARGQVFNVGEADTPTVRERLAGLPDLTVDAIDDGGYNFEQDIAYDTSRIRGELNYAEPVSYAEGIRRTLKP